MKKLTFLAIAIVLGITIFSFAETDYLLIDDFEVPISGGPEGTVDFGAGNGSSVEVTAEKSVINSGEQAIKVVYDAVPGGYMYIAKGAGLDAKNAAWKLKPEDIKWEEYEAISFYIFGTDSKQNIAFDIKDNGDELWRFNVVDDFKGWRKIVCSFDKFMVRDDWQPENADKNSQLDFPIKIFQFEPLPEGKGTIYIDTVELVKK
jgi:hypothetical protein